MLFRSGQRTPGRALHGTGSGEARAADRAAFHPAKQPSWRLGPKSDETRTRGQAPRDPIWPSSGQLAYEWPHGLRERGGVFVIPVVSTRCRGNVDAEALAEAVGYLSEEGKAVLAYE